MKIQLVTVVVAAAAAGGCVSRPTAAPREETPVSAPLARAEITDVVTPFEAGGVVRARNTAQIASSVMATVIEVYVRAGERVRRGAVLASLDARDLQADNARAEAASAAAAETVRAADADVRAAESALQLARAGHERMASLYAKRSATKEELDQAVAALASADAQRTGAQARVAAATSARDAAKAAADAAAVAATYAALRAPLDGVIVERRIDPGSMATPGAPLFTLEDPSAYHLEIQVDEARARAVAVGDAVETQIDSVASRAGGWTAGRIVEIARLDPASHAFLVKIDLPAADAMRSGLFGRARFRTAPRRALTVPSAAVVKRGQLTFVFVVDGDGRARLRPISAGAPLDARVEVLAGLTAGEVVVAGVPPTLTDGTRVDGARR